MTQSDTRYQIGYAILSKAAEPSTKRLMSALQMIADNMTDEQAERLQKSMRILEEGFKKPDPDSYAARLTNMMNKWAEQEFRKDMIYYSICYDGFRL